MDLDKWEQEHQQNAFIRLKGNDGYNLGRLLDFGRANRVVTKDQAKILTMCRMAGRVFRKAWFWEFADFIEDYQLTIGEPMNSRAMYMDALRFKEYSEHERSRFIGQLNMTGGSSK